MKTKGITWSNIHTIKTNPSLEETSEKMKKLWFFEWVTFQWNTDDNWAMSYYKMKKDWTTDFIIVKNWIEIEKTSENWKWISFVNWVWYKISDVSKIAGNVFYKKLKIDRNGDIIWESFYKDWVQFTKEYSNIEKYDISKDWNSIAIAIKTISGFRVVYGDKEIDFKRPYGYTNFNIALLSISDDGNHFYWYIDAEWISMDHCWNMVFSDKFEPISTKRYDVCNSPPFSKNWDTLMILRPNTGDRKYSVLFNWIQVCELKYWEFTHKKLNIVLDKTEHNIPLLWETIYIWEVIEKKIILWSLYIDTKTQKLVLINLEEPNSFKIKDTLGKNIWTTVKVIDDKYIEIGWKKFLKDFIKN